MRQYNFLLSKVLILLARLLRLYVLLGLLFAIQSKAQACPPPLQAPISEQIQQAQLNTQNRGYLWKISKGNHSSYLYGTIHVGRLEWIFPGPNLFVALTNSDVIALEVDPLDQEIQSSINSVRTEKSSVLIPQKLRQRLDRQIAAACAPSSAVAPFNPLMQAIIVSMLRGRFYGLEAAYGQEIALSSLARQTGKSVISLETTEIQLEALVPSNKQETLAILESLLAQLESGKTDRYYLRLTEIWNTSKLTELEDFETWCECAEKEIDKRMLKRINDDRNQNMAKRIDALHSQGKKVLAAIGALHMTGKLALPRLMEQRGFTVERIH